VAAVAVLSTSHGHLIHPDKMVALAVELMHKMAQMVMALELMDKVIEAALARLLPTTLDLAVVVAVLVL
jgi:hypothetical protein